MPQPWNLLPPTGSDPADEWVRLGIAAHVKNDHVTAETHYHHALRLEPAHPMATLNLAIVLAQTGRVLEGLAAIERATLFDPTLPTIWANWALMLLEADRAEQALTVARQAYAIAETPETRRVLAMVLTPNGQAADAVPLYDAMLDTDPADWLAGPNSCFIRTLTSPEPAEAQAARKRWYAAHRYTGTKAPHTNTRDPKKVLRVGYVGGDFKQHSAAFIYHSILFGHDRTQVEPYCYVSLALNPEADKVTASFKAAMPWREIHELDDEKAEAVIRLDAIDILVDLSGHTGGNRLELFTRKPAPIQVHAWGFAHGTGIPEIDYFFADPVALPLAERSHYAETVWDLPCIVTYTPPEYPVAAASTPPINRDPEGWLTFGVSSRYEKLSPACLAAWRDILLRVPESRLLLKDRAFRRPDAIRRIREAMEGVAPDRLRFAIDTNHPEHLASMQQADLILDPFPHTGGVVALEQLYMGVPIVTLYGRNPGERTTSSVLTAMGRPEWIAKSVEDYVQLAVEMAKDRQGLALARKTLRTELLKSPVIAGYPAAVDAAYRAMWGLYCAAG